MTLSTARAFLASSLILLTTCSVGLADDFRSQIIDPVDGKLDLSQYLLENTYGFLPIPFVVTEPAVGYGLGLGAAFFHDTEEKRQSRMAQRKASGSDGASFLPPSISAGIGLLTENDSWAVGGGHFGSWQSDKFRYTGAAGYADLNVKFYEPTSDTGFSSNIKGALFNQELLYRLAGSNWFAGGRYGYTSSTIGFELDQLLPGVDDLELKSSNAALSALLNYDSRDNILSPTHGDQFKIEVGFFDESLGGDFNYQDYNIANFLYGRLTDIIFLGFRAEAKSIDGVAPFYALPYIDLRGIPALRYQGKSTAVLELELRFQFTSRWSLNTFAGVGRAANKFGEISDAEDRWAGGAGFRYLIARELGIQAGVDIATGPEDTAIYIRMGTGW